MQRIGFIGQGWIGKNYADDFEAREFPVVRYGKEEAYAGNREAIGTCDIVFIAVPTPTTAAGFDDSIVREVIGLVGVGKTAVIKSTILPGTTESIQAEYPDRFIFHAPEFLREANAAYDAAHPARNIVGTPIDTETYRTKAREVLAVLPPAPYELVSSAREAELMKYAGNIFLYLKVVYANMLYDLAAGLGCDYETVRTAVAADPRIGPSHLNPVHMSGHAEKAGRGAGGHCFIKDMEAFTRLYADVVKDEQGIAALRAFIEKNNALLRESEKDLEILKGVYGTET